MAMNAATAMYRSTCNWCGELDYRWIKSVFFALILVVGVVFAWFFPWGASPPHGMKWNAWQTEPANGQNFQVLTTLLVQNREEVRFWQGILFNISLVFIGGVFGVLSLALKMTTSSESLRWTYTIAIVFLCAFYLIFVKVAEDAIALNHHDLTGIEIALKLAKPGEYIQGQPIYDHSEANQKVGRGEDLIKRLVPFGIFLAVLSVFGVLFLPNPPRDVGQRNDADGK
jgi:hypothetical protein